MQVPPLYTLDDRGGLFTKSCPTFVAPWTAACQAPLSVGFSRQEYWSELPFSSPGVFRTQRQNPCLLHCRRIHYRQIHQGSLPPKGIARAFFTKTLKSSVWGQLAHSQELEHPCWLSPGFSFPQRKSARTYDGNNSSLWPGTPAVLTPSKSLRRPLLSFYKLRREL